MLKKNTYSFRSTTFICLCHNLASRTNKPGSIAARAVGRSGERDAQPVLLIVVWTKGKAAGKNTSASLGFQADCFVFYELRQKQRSTVVEEVGQNAGFGLVSKVAMGPSIETRRPKNLKNVVVVCDCGHVDGGQSKVAITSAIALARLGIDVTFFCAVGPADPELARAGVRVVCLAQKDILNEPNRLKAIASGIWNRTAARKLKALLEEFDSETTVVHTHGFAKALSPSIGPVISSGRGRSLFTMHEFFLACPNGGFFDYRRNEICERPALGLDCITSNCDSRHASHKMWRVARQLVLRTAGNLPNGLRNVIYISETQRRVMAKYLDDSTQLHFVPNPISVERVARAKVSSNSTFLFVGRLSPEKGAVNFARAAARAGVRAVFVGDGRERSRILEANPDAIVTGWVGPDEVNRWLRKSRCLIFPSVWYETAGLVVYEASAHGVPSICGVWNAASEAISDGETGVLLRDSSEAELMRSIRLMMDDEKVESMSESAYANYWKAPFDMDRHVRNLLAVYQSVLSDT